MPLILDVDGERGEHATATKWGTVMLKFWKFKRAIKLSLKLTLPL